MKIKGWHIALAAAVVVLGVLWIRFFWFQEVFYTSKRNDPNRVALLRIRDVLNIGATHSDALGAYWSNRTDDLGLWAEKPTEWVIQTPLELSAGNLKLLIEFQDGRISGVKVRTVDGSAPKDGPPDKSKAVP